jgi:hypothetical protein
MSTDLSAEHNEFVEGADGVATCDGHLVGRLFDDMMRKESAEFVDLMSSITHSYKANSNNSKRLRAIGEESILDVLLSRCAWSKRKESNNTARLRKLHNLPVVVVDDTKIFCEDFVRNLDMPVFFSGKDCCEFSKDRLPSNGRYLPARQRLTVFDGTDGMHKAGVCTLLPRREALMTCKKKRRGVLYNSLIAIATNVKHGNLRQNSKRRMAIVDGRESGRYVVEGWFAYLNKRGISEHWFDELVGLKEAQDNIASFVKNIESRSKGYMDSKELLFNEFVKQRSGYDGIEFTQDRRSEIWPSMAFGKNVFLNVHRDEDYFWSITTVVTKRRCDYEVDSRVACYFCFPTKGFCVALRPGDILMFNACVDHCISSKCADVGNVICMSMYLKTAIVAGNDNSK